MIYIELTLVNIDEAVVILYRLEIIKYDFFRYFWYMETSLTIIILLPTHLNPSVGSVARRLQIHCISQRELENGKNDINMVRSLLIQS